MTVGPRLTRRDVIAGAAVAGAGVVLGPAAAAAARAARPHQDTGRVFAHDIGRLPAGIAAPITTDRPFCLLGVSWTGPGHPHLQLRTRLPDGRWGRWGAAGGDGHHGDAVVTRDRIGEPIWTGRSQTLQLRSDRALHGVRLLLVAPEPDRAPEPATAHTTGPEADLGTAGSTAAPSALRLAGPDLPAGPGQPPIIDRSVWAGANHRPVKGPYYGAIELGIVHHTENPNGYSRAQVPALLRAIYEFHVHGRGWYDIGYNFVVDHFGRVWEARQGGIDLPVSGAQAGDWNQVSFGVSLLGTYSAVVPSAAALAALERLLAWKMALNGLPVLGSVPEIVGRSGVGYTQFRSGQHVRFPRIAGHRDVDATTCPGDALYRHLPAMRPRVAALAGSPPTLDLTAEVASLAGVGTVLSLSGRLATRSGVSSGSGEGDGARTDDTGDTAAGIPDAPIVIQTVVGRMGETETLATTTTDADGGFAVSVAPRQSVLLRAVHLAAPVVVSPLIPAQRGGGAIPPYVGPGSVDDS